MKTDKKPKVLVISHNCFSNTQNNGKTLSSFFKGWDKENLAQLYFWGELPDRNVCDKFFRITDYEVLDSFINFKKIKGNDINCNYKNKNGDTSTKLVSHLSNNRGNNDGGNGLHKIIKNMFVNKSIVAFLLRDLIWNYKLKNIIKLNEWIEEYKPEVVFLQCSNVTFPYKIALKIATKYKIPLIIQFTDDYLTLKENSNLIEKLYNYNLVKNVRKAIDYSSSIFAIGEFMANEYKYRFGGNYEVFMNSIEIDLEEENKVKYDEDRTIKFIYAGSIHTNRWKTLSKLGEKLNHLKEKGIKCEFDIYTNIQPSKKELEAITYENVMSYKGSLTLNELEEKIKLYDILVHVEAFDKKSKHITRLSISTKIPEYLAKRKSILAIGPSDVASIKYLKDNEAAHIISDLDSNMMEEKLKCLIQDEFFRNKMINNAWKLAKQRHDAIKNRALIEEIIRNI